MDIAQLQYFRIVATLQHVTKAAEELNISQSALSQSITRLEEELGVELFERYGRCIRLNEYGKAFLPEVEQTLASLEKGRRLLKGMQAQSGNSVVIIASALLGFPNLIPHICSDCESVNISTFNCPVDRVVSKLKTGEADFCLMPVRFEDPSLDHHLLRLCEQGVLVVDTHPLSGKRVSVDCFRDEAFVAFGNGTAPRANFDALCIQAGWKPHITLEVDNYSDLVRAVCTGEYVSVAVSEIYRNYANANNRLRFVQLAETERMVGLTLYWLSGCKPRPIVQAVKDSIINYFSNGKRCPLFPAEVHTIDCAN